MAYNGGPIIGALLPNTTYVGITAAPANWAGAVSSALNIPSWPVNDGATTPRAIPYTAGSLVPSRYWAAIRGIASVELEANALFSSTQIPNIGGTASFIYYNKGASSFTSLARIIHSTGDNINNYFLSGSGISINYYSDSGSRAQSLIFDHDSTSALCYYTDPDAATSTNNPIYIGEFDNAFIQEIPYNQELITYKRTRTDPAVQEVKTLDGAIRKVKTGKSSTNVSASFQWSDNGAIAYNVDKILESSREKVTPLLLYVPEGIYYNGPFLDLVVPTNNPAVIMPAPGVYSLTIEGTCQP